MIPVGGRTLSARLPHGTVADAMWKADTSARPPTATMRGFGRPVAWRGHISLHVPRQHCHTIAGGNEATYSLVLKLSE